MEATLEAQQLPAKLPQELVQYQITPANARELARKAHESRRARVAAEAQAKLKLEAEAEKARAIILANAMAMPSPVALEPDDQYRLASLARTRGQIEKLEAMLDECTEAKDMKALADAIARMRDVEQTLAKRPKPAAYRTAPEKPKRNQASSGPVED